MHCSMKPLLYIVKDRLTEVEMADVQRVLSLTPVAGVFATTIPALDVARQLSECVVFNITSEPEDVIAKARVIADELQTPVVVVTESEEVIKVESRHAHQD